MRLLIITVFALLAISCKTQERKKADAIKWIVENPKDLDRWQGLFYYNSKSEYIKGEDFKVRDTIPRIADCPDGTKVKCPDCFNTIRVDTVKEDKPQTIAAIQALQRELIKAESNIEHDKSDISKKQKYIVYLSIAAVVLLLIICLLAFLLFKRKTSIL